MMLLLHIFGKLEDNRNSFHKIAGMEDARERLEASVVSEGERQPNLITAISTIIRKPRKRATGNHVLIEFFHWQHKPHRLFFPFDLPLSLFSSFPNILQGLDCHSNHKRNVVNS
jgi:hypothetical protein